MGNLKIELDIPEFKDSLELTISIKRDGNQVCITEDTSDTSSTWKWKQEIASTTTTPVSSLPSSGNLMNMDMNF